MAADIVSDGYGTRYEQRLKLATTVIRQHSDLTEQQARALAAHVIYALDHISEKVR
jgi:uncharacterized protein DUF6307